MDFSGNESRRGFTPYLQCPSTQRISYKPWHQKIWDAAQVQRGGIVCLFSVFELFGIKHALTGKVWLAIPNKARVTAKLPENVELLRFSEESLSAGKIDVAIGRLGTVQAHLPPKAIVDCFKFRGRLASRHGITLDQLLHILQEMCGVYKPKRTRGSIPIKAIESYLDVCRMRNVMGPYLEALKHRGNQNRKDRKGTSQETSLWLPVHEQRNGLCS